jgi:acyl-CoA hydrolase
MDWRKAVGDKLVTPQEAVKAMRPGQQVMVAPFTCTPFTLCAALYERLPELPGLQVGHPAGLFPWFKADAELDFRLCTNYATPMDRDAINLDYVVTEHGIATLRGKTVRERIGELIGVAHPDFRGELKMEAKRLYGVTM